MTIVSLERRTPPHLDTTSKRSSRTSPFKPFLSLITPLGYNLLTLNPHYMLGRHSNGKESAVSLRELVQEPSITPEEGPASSTAPLEDQHVGIEPCDSDTDSLETSDTESLLGDQTVRANVT